MIDTTNVKNCPVCGCEPNVYDRRNTQQFDTGPIVVYCSNDECYMSGVAAYGIDAWNRFIENLVEDVRDD